MEIQETEPQLIETAREALSRCHWTVGECAAKWTQRYAAGRTDADFAALVGLSADQVYQRRRVWETFSDVAEDYSALKWSHFYIALSWDDAPESLQWAEENHATVAEMRAWRRLQHGEDLTVAAEDEAESDFGADDVTFVPDEPKAVRDPEEFSGAAGNDRAKIGNGSERRSEKESATVGAVARGVEGSGGDYAPFRQGAGSPAPKESSGGAAVAERPNVSPEQLIRRMTKSVERCNEALSPAMVKEFRNLPEKVRNKFIKAVGELSSKAAGLI